MVFLFALWACTDDPQPQDDWTPPGEEGPFLVGTEEHAFDAPNAGVQLPVQIWFPASDGDDEVEVTYQGFLPSGAIGEPVPDCSEVRPLMVFSHGNGGIRFQSLFLTEFWATRGAITLAPDHVDNTFLDPDPRLNAAISFRRPLDISDTVDWFYEQTADPGHPLHDCVDPDAGYQVSGHSYGAYTALAVGGAKLDLAHLDGLCENPDDFLCDALEYWWADHPGETLVDRSDDRVTAVLPMTPAAWQMFGDHLADIVVPTLIMGASEDSLTTMATEVRPTWERLAATPRYLAVLEGADHFSYSNLCSLIPMGDYCDEGSLDMEKGHRVIREAATAFLDVARGETRSAEWLPLDHDLLTWESVE